MSAVDGFVETFTESASGVTQTRGEPQKCVHCGRSFPGLMIYHPEIQSFLCRDLRCKAWLDGLLEMEVEIFGPEDVAW